METGAYIVTGANAGIGYEIARALAQQGNHTVLICRNAERGTAALNQLTSQTDGAVDLVLGDLSSLAAVRTLAANLLAQYPSIACLIHNAGIWMTHKQLNEDGLELSFMVNHLAPFMLTQLLSERLMASAPARIVYVSAGLYIKGAVDVARTPMGNDFGRIKTYCNTKLCSVLTLEKLAGQFAESNVTVNMVHPGVIRTGLGDSNGIVGWLLRQIKRSWATPEEGADAPVWLATDPALAETTGLYFDEKKEMPLADVAKDTQLANQVWQLSLRLSGLADPVASS